MANVGVDFFPTGKKTLVEITSMEGVLENVQLYQQLIGVVVLAQPEAQFHFERGDDEEKMPCGNAIDGKHFFSFTAGEAVTHLKEAGKDASDWEKIDPDTICTLIGSACTPVVDQL
jgi:hypothetical protein